MTTDWKNVADNARNQSDAARRSLEQDTREFARIHETANEAAKDTADRDARRNRRLHLKMTFVNGE